jgi:hypothetical protein
MNKIIPFDESYIFSLSEEISSKTTHPVSDYFFKIDDLSINLLISLKWLFWGYKFLSSISEKIKDLDEYEISCLITNSIQSPSILNISEENHIILIDNNIIKNNNELLNLVSNLYSLKIFDENTKIHLKLKLNLREYLIVSNILFPSFTKYNNKK